MRKIGEKILLSASDLMRFIGCDHATTLDLQYLHHKNITPKADSDDAQLLQNQGNAHEAQHLDKLYKSGASIIEINRSPRLEDDVLATLEALKKGPDVVFQGAFLNQHWGGWSDFLEKVEKPSALGPFSYEVTDTKLKRKPHPKHVLQLVLYSDLLTEIQQQEPEYAHIELGNGTRSSLKLSDYKSYARLARKRFEQFVRAPAQTRPVPCSDCSLCRWQDLCKEHWAQTDSLFEIANISRSQVKKIEAVGLDTMQAFAGANEPIRGLSHVSATKLQIQARLQQARKTGEPTYELRDKTPGKGFDLLPEPSDGDLFYDIEGDPHFPEGLEYLHGVWFNGGFQTFWAHSHEEEAKKFGELLDFFRVQLDKDPSAHIYHYAPYEITALRRLSSKYAIGEAFIDRLLREQKFVDLYAVVRGSVQTSEPSYSIKYLEIFYGLKRESEVKTAGGSVIAYEKWRDIQDQSILDEIEEYNRVDCVSTEMLRDWLISIRPPNPWPIYDLNASDKEADDEAAVLQLKERLALSPIPDERKAILLALSRFHNREAKPAWWTIFDSLNSEEDDIIDDMNTLGGLEAIGPVTPVKRSFSRLYKYPLQETKLREGKRPTIKDELGFSTISIEQLDIENREVLLKIGAAKANLLTEQVNLLPEKPISSSVISLALDDVINDQLTHKLYKAVDDLLSLNSPRLLGGKRLEAIPTLDSVQLLKTAVSLMDETTLAVQGPPGTGKTYVSAHAIIELVRSGKRIGIASNSHEAIRNLMIGCVDAMQPEDTNITLAHKVGQSADGYPSSMKRILRPTSNDDANLNNANIVGGTAFFFARAEQIDKFDYLFIDEAGQVSLPNVLAMGRSTKNIVLVGDPQQLPNVIQGSHPYPAGLSSLEWLLGDHLTVPKDRGIFLPSTRRMHPKICDFISEQVYDGRLISDPSTHHEAIISQTFPPNGAYWVDVEHDGNSQSSLEEAEAISKIYKELVGSNYSSRMAKSVPLSNRDIIIVAPYNAQVNLLKSILPVGARIGTVDKFQGQEAAVSIISMTASSTENIPRGMNFLFSLNRINVAVSRAKALSLVLGSSKLRNARCDNIEQMKMVNTLCVLEKIPLKY